MARLPGNYVLSQGDALKIDAGDERFDTLVNAYMFDLIPFDSMGAVFTRIPSGSQKGW